MKKKSVVFSAIRPSGDLTIGNYIGVIKKWIELQNNYNCLYCIADLHALNNSKDIFLNNCTLDTLSIYLAAGIDPNKSIIFKQSDVYEHTQLQWILNYFTNVSELMRMTQFKSKITEGYKVGSSLLNYPLLMASDIILYNTNIVPIGKDQIQHLEFTRNIVTRFNKIYGSIFTLPNFLTLKYGSKIMSLLEPCKKMSKSDINKNNVIFLLDNLNCVVDKIKRSVTDSDNPSFIYYDKKKKPGISNLLVIFSELTNKNIITLENFFFKKKYSFLKERLSDVVLKFLIKLQKKYWMYRKNESYLINILNKGALKAKLIAKKTLYKVYKAINIF
ncbi:tryptophan--tRNA ligase [Buchnera aphidicola]|uniref:tryptophan--tRNA ligase n=1 Tax=Buchnera aphidicola TaxID=9 RepID=UPI0031B838CD